MAINPPNTITKTSHSLDIYDQRGNLIGMINSWSPQMSRQITPVYEIAVRSSGDPVENVPGNVTGLNISISRYDLYTKAMESAFGTRNIQMLSDQNSPFSVREQWKYPDNTLEVWLYEGCWLSNVGRTLQSTNDRIVNVTATLAYVRKVRLQ